jgi:hypothetical protein
LERRTDVVFLGPDVTRCSRLNLERLVAAVAVHLVAAVAVAAVAVRLVAAVAVAAVAVPAASASSEQASPREGGHPFE